MEALLEDVSFSAMEMRKKTVTIDSRYVQKQLADVVRDKDMSRYIL
jgi:ATP-dependent HslUV protease ATP-binding subunit HslU